SIRRTLRKCWTPLQLSPRKTGPRSLSPTKWASRSGLLIRSSSWMAERSAGRGVLRSSTREISPSASYAFATACSTERIHTKEGKRMGSLKLLTAALAAVAAILVSDASPANAEGTLDKIKRTGKFLAGVRYDYPPVGSVDRDGKNIGFGVDIAKAFAEKLGVEPTFVQTTSRNRIPLLQSGGIDADIGPTTPTKERDEVVDFSIVYYWDE